MKRTGNPNCQIAGSPRSFVFIDGIRDAETGHSTLMELPENNKLTASGGDQLTFSSVKVVRPK
jgi:hypothetical protein